MKSSKAHIREQVFYNFKKLSDQQNKIIYAKIKIISKKRVHVS
jgi:hypothetical protein